MTSIHELLGKILNDEDINITEDVYMKLCKVTMIDKVMDCEKKQCDAVLHIVSEHIAPAGDPAVNKPNGAQPRKSKNEHKKQRTNSAKGYKCGLRNCHTSSVTFADKSEFYEHVRVKHMGNLAALICPLNSCHTTGKKESEMRKHFRAKHLDLLDTPYSYESRRFRPTFARADYNLTDAPPPLPTTYTPGILILPELELPAAKPRPSTPPNAHAGPSIYSQTPRSPAKSQRALTREGSDSPEPPELDDFADRGRIDDLDAVARLAQVRERSAFPLLDVSRPPPLPARVATFSERDVPQTNFYPAYKQMIDEKVPLVKVGSELKVEVKDDSMLQKSGGVSGDASIASSRRASATPASQR
ncbi:hypothetical protein CYLTODRAFT_487813 [Cylindrobasidium torrendii FP15055 ss-10]|uniref:C2H2-type domain-containing protein n=1 Tax=Cylindrobasidium torrendii FP15055 ss-10 TaxID=1314674 RepID=A0A0D7BJT9_9AGAR|nr:hypothetical protein CYLTODRAFT_487813 [Cylindrobasidium torrendii FP15055 ss-10]